MIEKLSHNCSASSKTLQNAYIDKCHIGLEKSITPCCINTLPKSSINQPYWTQALQALANPLASNALCQRCANYPLSDL